MLVIEKGQEFWYQGKLICVATRDCFEGEAATPYDFRWIGVDQPSFGEPIHPAILNAFKQGKIKENS